MVLKQGVFLDLETVDPRDLDLRALQGALEQWTFHDFTTPAQLHERICSAQVLVTNKVVLDAQAFAAAKALQLVCLTATGTNNVDLEAARQHGVSVCNARDYATASVVQHVFALILALTTQLPAYTRDLAAGRWQDSRQFCLLDHPIRELSAQRLGIIGYGVLGQATAAMARAWGLEVLVAESLQGPKDPAIARYPLAQVLAEADIISLHCPLTPQTRHLIDAKAIGLMRPDALLINTARGAIVDAQALAQALREGRLGGAGIDVLDQEPPPADHPLLAPDIPRLILTPHVAWAAREARQRLVDQVAETIRAFLRGTPRHQVN
ncbi:D-2-hydroxyacid dehydrogenase [Thiorhodospira sibirica]|uniref:D-2-hydroxyacid dehydrogenase n=1 Tax=Thiorhodospira sibirica TaxID=154347 RepID=UPI00022C0B86|nr:D-2-hydroxyacid dehydrogenase [Thiorhodospira sibirica]